VKICHEHWQQLRWRVCERGLGHLLHHPHGEFEDLTAELCGRRPVPNPFDPLASCREVAESLALARGGLYLNRPGADGRERCPVCELVRCECGEPLALSREEYWPAAIVDTVVKVARGRGLMPRVA